MTDSPRPPADLTARSKRLWVAVLADFELSPAELELLRSALLALDRADQAAEVVKRDGVVVVDRYGTPKQHPACDVEARNRVLYARFIAQLGVKLAVTPLPRRGARTGPPPRLAQARRSA